MQSKKSFLEIIYSAISTFRSSFWEIILTYCFSLPFFAVIYYVLHLLQPNKSTNMSPAVIILMIPLFYGAILLQTWQILIIKDHIFKGVTNLLKTFKKSLLKSLQVCLIVVLFLFILAAAAFILARAFPSCINILPFLCIPLVPFVISFLGIVLQDGKFINILINSLGICVINYFRILEYMLILMLISFIVMKSLSMLSIIPLFLFFVIILIVFFNLMAEPFYICFLEELYFDLVIIDGEKPLEDLTELSESYPDAIDINQSENSVYKEEQTLQSQQNTKEEIPEGLQQLGGNYQDKK